MAPGTVGFRAGSPATWPRPRRSVCATCARGGASIPTDVGCARHAIELFGWITPGEVKLFGLDAVDRAKAWVAEPLPDG
jgi:hypothetical protein